jgi:energy-coupling factor transport system permease protein
MECRCYTGGEGRTRMKQMHLSLRDWFVMLFFLLLFCGIPLLSAFSFSVGSIL